MRDLFVKAANGNPGAAHVLGKVWQSNSNLGLGVAFKMVETKSHSPGLWMIYNVICDKDLLKTCECLMAWLTPAHGEPDNGSLQDWMPEKFPQTKDYFESFNQRRNL